MSNSNIKDQLGTIQNKKTFYSTKEFIQSICRRELLLSCAVYEKISKVTVDGKEQWRSTKKTLEKVHYSDKEYFNDPEYPPDNQYLNVVTQQNSSFIKFMLWFRLNHFFREKYSLYKEIKMRTQVAYNPNYSHITDALNVLSTQPGLVLRLFEKKKVNDKGIYSVWLNMDGAWKNYVIDDHLPVFGDASDRTQFFFTTPNSKQKEIWYCLLEKALAKAYGGYHALQNISEGQAVMDFTGAPYQTHQITLIPRGKIPAPNEIQHMQWVWDWIKNCLKKSDIISVNPRPMSQEEAQRNQGRGAVSIGNNTRNHLDQGIYTGHSYAIVTIADVQGADGNHYKLIKLRNPWINEIWRGNWSDESPLWTADIKRKLKYHPERTGMNQFWMSLRDFFTYFTSMNIYKPRPGFTFNSIEVNFLKNKRYMRSIVRISVSSRGKYTFSVNQKSSKSQSINKRVFNPVTISLGMINDQGFNLLSHTSGDGKRNTHIRKLVEKGEYYLLIEQYCDIKNHPEPRQSQNVVVSSYGPQTCGLKLINDTKKAELMYDYLYYYGWKGYSLARNGDKLTELRVNFYDGSVNIVSLHILDVPNSIIYAFKNDNHYGVELTLKIEGLPNKEILGPEGVIGFNQKFTIDPNSTDVFVLREKQIRDFNNGSEIEGNTMLKFLSVVGRKFEGYKAPSKAFQRAVKSLLKESPERMCCELEINIRNGKKWGLFDPKGNEISYKQRELPPSPSKLNISPASFVDTDIVNKIFHQDDDSQVQSYQSQKTLSASDLSEEESEEEEESIKKSKKGLRVSYYDEVYKEEIERGEMDRENLKHHRARSVGGEVGRTKSILKNKNMNEEKEKRNVENIEKIAKEIGPIDDDKLTKLISLQKEEVLELPNEELKMILKYFGIHAFVSIYQADQKFIDDISEKLSKDNTKAGANQVSQIGKSKESIERERREEEMKQREERKKRENELIEEERKRAEEEERLEKMRQEEKKRRDKSKKRKKKKKATFAERPKSSHRRMRSGNFSQISRPVRKKTPKKIISQSKNKLIENSLKNFTPKQESKLNKKKLESKKEREKKKKSFIKEKEKKKKKKKFSERPSSRKSRASSKKGRKPKSNRMMRNFTSSSPKFKRMKPAPKKGKETLEELRKRIKSIKDLKNQGKSFNKSSFRNFGSPVTRKRGLKGYGTYRKHTNKTSRKSNRSNKSNKSNKGREIKKMKLSMARLSATKPRKKRRIGDQNINSAIPSQKTAKADRDYSRKSSRAGSRRSGKSRSLSKGSSSKRNIYNRIAFKVNNNGDMKKPGRKRSSRKRRVRSKNYSNAGEANKLNDSKISSIHDSMTSQDLMSINAQNYHNMSTKSQQDDAMKNSYFNSQKELQQQSSINMKILASNFPQMSNSTPYTPKNEAKVVYRGSNIVQLQDGQDSQDHKLFPKSGMNSFVQHRNKDDLLRDSYYSVNVIRNSNFIHTSNEANKQIYANASYINPKPHTNSHKNVQSFIQNQRPPADKSLKFIPYTPQNQNFAKTAQAQDQLFKKKPVSLFNSNALRGSRSYFKKSSNPKMIKPKSSRRISEAPSNGLRKSGYRRKTAKSQKKMRQSNYIPKKGSLEMTRGQSGSLSHSNLPKHPQTAPVHGHIPKPVDVNVPIINPVSPKNRQFGIQGQSQGVVGYGISAALNQGQGV